MAYTQEFPKCCGIEIYVDFGSDGFFSRTMSKDEVRNYIKVKSKGRGLTLIALNDKQIPLFENIVLSEGFEVLVKEFFHPGHLSRTTLYGRVNYTEKEAQEKIKSVKEFEAKCQAEYERQEQTNLTATQVRQAEEQYSSTASQTDSLTPRRASTSSASTTEQPSTNAGRQRYYAQYYVDNRATTY